MSNSEWVSPNEIYKARGQFYRANAGGSGELLIPAKHAISIGVAAFLVFSSGAFLFAIGGLLGSFVERSAKFGAASKAPIELFSEQRSAPAFVFTTEPRDIELQIMSKAEFERTRNHVAVEAYAYPSMRPCRIVVPEGWGINVFPKSSFASWSDPRHGHYIAHEIAHCFLGSWHP